MKIIDEREGQKKKKKKNTKEKKGDARYSKSVRAK